MDVNTILQAVTPFLVYAAVATVKLLKTAIPGWVITVVLVPLMSTLISLASGIVFPGAEFWSQLVSGLLAVFLYEVKKQLGQG